MLTMQSTGMRFTLGSRVSLMKVSCIEVSGSTFLTSYIGTFTMTRNLRTRGPQHC